jgi:acyl-CoA synthetase (AMP-forming)/AMP-acid ligase II
MLNKRENLFREEPGFRELNWLATDSTEGVPPDIWKRPDITGDFLAFLQYTSGSTALPKGVMVDNANLIHNMSYINEAGRNDEQSTSVSWLPSYHDMGLIEAIVQPTFSGYTSYLMPPASFIQKPVRWMRSISDLRATSSGGPNFAFDLCNRKISDAEISQMDLSSLRYIYNGSEPVRRGVMELFYDRFKRAGLRKTALNPVYGMAEATLMISSTLPSDEPLYLDVDAEQLKKNFVVENSDEGKTMSLVGCGKIFHDMEVKIVQPDTQQPSSENEVGEIWLSGPSVARGYWRRQTETQETFTATLSDSPEKNYLRTGDLGFLKYGQIFITGRIKDLIIIRGNNYYPQDIELVVENSAPEFLQSNSSVAFSLDVEDDEKLFIVTEVHRKVVRQNTPALLEEIRSRIRKSVADGFQLTVHHILFIKPSTLPKTTSGKVQRKKTRALHLERKLDYLEA